MDYFNQVDNFLVIEESNPEQTAAARSTDTGLPGGKDIFAKKVSNNRWTNIAKFYLIEPSDHVQLY
eukprot:1216184-Ditylum_brightwellii.AAC.1